MGSKDHDDLLAKVNRSAGDDTKEFAPLQVDLIGAWRRVCRFQLLGRKAALGGMVLVGKLSELLGQNLVQTRNDIQSWRKGILVDPLEEAPLSFDLNVILDFHLTGNYAFLESVASGRMLISDFVENELSRSNQMPLPPVVRSWLSRLNRNWIFFTTLNALTETWELENWVQSLLPNFVARFSSVTTATPSGR